MNYKALFSLLSISLLSSTALTGCSIGSIPDVATTATPVEVKLAPITGNNYGGHAPLAGAHIYLVQPGTSGYGSVVKGLLTATSANSAYPTVQNGNWTNSTYGSDQFVPATDANGNPFYGIQADSTSQYQLSGDYTCTVGQPVIIIGYGGSPSFIGTSQNTFTVNNVTEVNNGSTAANFTFTYTTTTPNLFYVGQSVSVTGYSGGEAGFANSGVVLASGLSATTFSINVAYGQNANLGNNTPSNLSSTTTATAVGSPVFNPAAVNMAVLGNCPASGNFSTAGSGAISYVYMNEVSTTAAAYAFAGFLNTTVNDQSGNDEFHIGSSGTTQGLVGIANAATTAGLLYDIQGSNTSTTYAGEGHIGRTTTPNGGFGKVPQTTLDTIGNILAACVDSNNTYRRQAGTVSPACNTLESTAQDNGVVDGSTILTATSTHVAFNTAQAAFNMARFPQGAGTTTTTNGAVTTNNATTASSFVSALFNIPTGNVPFAPYLTSQPNDFSVPILWQVGNLTTDVEIDANGNAFVAGGTNGLYQITPAGVISTISGSANNLSSALSAGVAIDYNGSVWASGTTGVFAYNAAGGVHAIDGNNAGQGAGLAVDNLAFSSNGPNIYMTAGSDGSSSTYTSELNKQFGVGGAPAGGNFPIVSGNTSATAGACANAIGFVTLDSSNNVWTATSNNSQDFGFSWVCRFNSAGTLQYTLNVPSNNSAEAGGFSFPRGLATDNGDNVFFNDKNLNALYKITKGTTTANAYAAQTITSSQLAAPSWVAVDGANTIWVSNSGDAGATTGSKYGTGLVQFSDSATVMTPAYITGTTGSSTPATCLNSVSVDPSGNIWSSQAPGQGACSIYNQVVEFVGIATPTITPIAVAKASSGLVGTKP
jgi:hypothetical protein